MPRTATAFLLVLAGLAAQEGADPRDRPRYRIPLAPDPTGSAIAGPFQPPGLPFLDRPDWRLWWSFHWEELLGVPAHGGRAFGGKDRNEHALPALLAALRDGDAAVRAAAAVALGKGGFAEAVPPLLLTLNDGNLRVRNAAALGLGLSGAKAAEAPLLALFDDHETRAWTQVWAAVALGYLGTPKARQALLGRIGELAKTSSSADVADVLLACALGLGASGSPDGIVELLTSPKIERQLAPPLRALLVEALGKTRARSALAQVEKELRSAAAAVRAAAAVALGAVATVEDGTAVAALAHAAAGDAHGAVRAQAIVALGRLGGEQPLAVLRELAKKTAGDHELRPFVDTARAFARDPALRAELGARLRSGDAGERGPAALALAILGERAAAGDLVRALERERDATAFADLALACGLLQVPEARPLLEQALAREEDAEHRTAAAVGLHLLGADDVAARLARLLHGATSARRQAPILFAALMTRDARLCEDLARLARREGVQDTVRALACTALGHVADPRRRSALVALAAGHSWLVSVPHLDELLTMY
jgi:HEAT repeat protein